MVSNHILIVDSITLASSNTMRNFGVIFDQIFLLSFICAICLKLETACLGVMLKNYFTITLQHLLLLDSTTVIHFYQAVLKLPEKFSFDPKHSNRQADIDYKQKAYFSHTASSLARC